MGANMGHETDALNFLAEVSREPYRYDFYQTLRRLECLYAQKPRWGSALRPIDEPVRLGQEPELAFAPAPLASLEFGRDGAPPRLQVRLFGLLGPNGLSTRGTGSVTPAIRRSAGSSICSIIDSSRCSIVRGRRRSRTSTAIERDRIAIASTWARSSASRRRRCGSATRSRIWRSCFTPARSGRVGR